MKLPKSLKWINKSSQQKNLEKCLEYHRNKLKECEESFDHSLRNKMGEDVSGFIWSSINEHREYVESIEEFLEIFEFWEDV